MATIHANTQLKAGDTVNGLSGLKDCESGRCLNLRLDGKAVAPEGWPSVCQPPHVRYFYVNLNLHEHNPSVPPYKSLRVDVATKQEAVNLLKQFYAGYSDSNFGCAEEPITKSFAEALERYSVCHTQRQLCTPDRKSKVWCSGGVFARFCPRENAPDVCKGKTTWPKETCSELIYNAASGRFKPACAQHDPHLPNSLKNERRCLSLCDAEGNCVIIRKTERGIELWQEKYKQRTLIDPATGKVLSVKYEKNRIIKELKLTFNDIEIKRNIIKQIIRVGEQSILSASQPITVKLEGGIKLIKQYNTQVLISGEEVGRAVLNADSLCESQKIELDVKPSSKDEYLAALWPALEAAGITRNKNELAAFLASSDVETHGGTSMREKLGYSLERWRGLAKEGNQKNIQNWLDRHMVNTEVEFAKISIEDQLNIMYEGMNGNVEFGDGYKFRGRGGFHLTGRGNYYAFAKHINRMDIMDNPDLLVTDPDLAVKSAIWFWTKYRPELPDLARQGNYKRVRRMINGGNVSIVEYNRLIQSYLSGKGALIRQ